MKKLNLGCGRDYRKGWVNIDFLGGVRKDIALDLNKIPYPFKKNEFDEVLASHVLEHLDDPIKVLKEIVRICKNGAKLVVKVPHAFSYANVTDLQHRTNFTENSFSDNHLREYNLEELKLIKVKFLFPVNKWKRYIPVKKYLKIFFNGVYDDIRFEFKVIKK